MSEPVRVTERTDEQAIDLLWESCCSWVGADHEGWCKAQFRSFLAERRAARQAAEQRAERAEAALHAMLHKTRGHRNPHLKGSSEMWREWQIIHNACCPACAVLRPMRGEDARAAWRPAAEREDAARREQK